MKFRVKVNYKDADDDEDPWWETYEKDVDDPRKWAEATIAKFNKHLKPGRTYYKRKRARAEKAWDGPETKSELDADDNPDVWDKVTVPPERPRVLLDVEVLDEDAVKDHTWIKTSTMTQTDHRGMFDDVECTRCGITGKRYGVNRVRLDYKYRRSKVYHRCDTAKEHIEEHDHPKGS